MADVKVYLYDYFDGLLKRERRSTEYATADTIVARRGTIIAESERVVDEALIHDDGTILAHQIPLPQEDEQEENERQAAAGMTPGTGTLPPQPGSPPSRG
jgi:hypothetical protein